MRDAIAAELATVERERGVRILYAVESGSRCWGMARGNTKDFIDEETVGAKRYLYVLRALLSARWCVDERTPAPMLLSELVEAKLPRKLHAAVEELLAVKAAGGEKARVRRIAALDEWLECQDAELYAIAQAEPDPERVAWDVLDQAFLDIVR